MKGFLWIDRAIGKGASGLLVVTVLTIFIAGLSSIVLRWFHLSFMWLDPLIRHLLFLSAFLSGIVITGKNKHLSIDLLNKYLESFPLWHQRARRIVYLTSVLTLLWLIKASWDFLLSEIQYGKVQFLGIHSAVWVAVIPVGLFLMSYRFFYLFLESFQKEKQC